MPVTYEPVFVFIGEDGRSAARMRQVLVEKIPILDRCQCVLVSDPDVAMERCRDMVDQAIGLNGYEVKTLRFMLVSVPELKNRNGVFVSLAAFLVLLNVRVRDRVSHCAVFSSQPSDALPVQRSQHDRYPGVRTLYFDPGWLAPYSVPLEEAVGDFLHGRNVPSMRPASPLIAS